MEPVTIVVAALVAGAAAGASETMSAAVRDLYEGLKSLVIGRFRQVGVEEAEGQRLIANASDQGLGKAALIRELTRAEVDEATIDAAKMLLQLVEAVSERKFQVEVRDSTGVVVGDNNTQTINIHPR